MTTQTDHEEPTTNHDLPPTTTRRSAAAIFSKVPHEIRQQIDQAIIERGPGQNTYREIFDTFQLADQHGLSFPAFKRYAKTVAWKDRIAGERSHIEGILPSANKGPSAALLRRTANALIFSVLDAVFDEENPPTPQQLYHLALVFGQRQTTPRSPRTRVRPQPATTHGAYLGPEGQTARVRLVRIPKSACLTRGGGFASFACWCVTHV